MGPLVGDAEGEIVWPAAVGAAVGERAVGEAVAGDTVDSIDKEGTPFAAVKAGVNRFVGDAEDSNIVAASTVAKEMLVFT